MKVFRNNACYVNIGDLVMQDLPKYLVFDKVVYEKDDFVIFTDQKSIDYVKNRQDIIDYDEVCFLDENGLNQKIDEMRRYVEDYAKRLLDTPLELKAKFYQDEDYIKNVNLCRGLYYDLIYYKKNREKIDETITELISRKVI